MIRKKLVIAAIILFTFPHKATAMHKLWRAIPKLFSKKNDSDHDKTAKQAEIAAKKEFEKHKKDFFKSLPFPRFSRQFSPQLISAEASYNKLLHTYGSLSFDNAGEDKTEIIYKTSEDRSILTQPSSGWTD